MCKLLFVSQPRRVIYYTLALLHENCYSYLITLSEIPSNDLVVCSLCVNFCLSHNFVEWSVILWVISTGLIALVQPPHTWIFIVLDDNLLVSTSATEVYGPCEHLPWFVCLNRRSLFARELLLVSHYLIRDSLWWLSSVTTLSETPSDDLVVFALNVVGFSEPS